MTGLRISFGLGGSEEKQSIVSPNYDVVGEKGGKNEDVYQASSDSFLFHNSFWF